MNFGEAIGSGFRRYVDFQGRSSRSEYWFWALFTFLVGCAIGVIQVATYSGDQGPAPVTRVLGLVVDLALLFPSLAVAIRRLHDVNRSGWWYLIILTIIGVIPILIWFCTRGTEGPNRYGEDPLGAKGGVQPAVAPSPET
jgi:uncharacterized membrane protein YhaH (DUF805 family)